MASRSGGPGGAMGTLERLLRGGGGRPGEPGYSREGRRDTRSYLGVHDDYVAERPDSPARGFTGDTSGVRPSIPYQPRYREGDEWTPANTSPASIWDMQQALTSAGLMPFGTEFQKGTWDEPTRNAYKALLEMANANGLTDEQMLSQLQASGGLQNRGYFDPETGEWVTDMGSGGAGSGRNPLVYQIPNKEEVRQVLRQSIIENLGQGWNEERINRLADQYIEEFKRPQTQAYNAGERGGSYVEAPSVQSFAQSQAESVDPTGYQANQAMGFVDEIMSLIAAPRWGGGDG